MTALAVVTLVAICHALARADAVNASPGELRAMIANPEAVTTLSVSGSIDASDLDFIADGLPALTSLDLSAATIAAYHGSRPLRSGRTASAANTLPEYSLAGCSRLQALILPASLRAIAPAALAGCTALKSLAIPAGVDSIGHAAFNGCSALRSVVLPSGIRRIAPITFKGCSALEAIDLGATSVEAIDSAAFAGCASLTEAALPPTLARIGERAFLSTAIAALDLSHCSRLTEIGSFAYAHDESLSTVTLPDHAVTLGRGIFFDCTELHTVILSDNTTALPPYILKGTALDDAASVLHPSVKSIGRYALHGTSALTELTLPESLDSIGSHAMGTMTGLLSIDATGLEAPPALGDDVFDATPVAGVTLLTTEEAAPLFKAAPQWQDFDIMIKSNTDVGSVTLPDDIRSISLLVDREAIRISAPKAIAAVAIYSTAGGMILNHLQAVPAADVTVPLGPLTLPPYSILRITFSDRSSTSLKIARP